MNKPECPLWFIFTTKNAENHPEITEVEMNNLFLILIDGKFHLSPEGISIQLSVKSIIFTNSNFQEGIAYGGRDQ